MSAFRPISGSPLSPESERSTVHPRFGDDRFVSEAMLDQWIRAGTAMRAGPMLTLADGRRYVLQDALRIIGRRNGDTDPYGFTGRVECIRQLIKQGAVVAHDAIRLGPAVYDVEYGVLAYNAASADESGANPRVG